MVPLGESQAMLPFRDNGVGNSILNGSPDKTRIASCSAFLAQRRQQPVSISRRLKPRPSPSARSQPSWREPPVYHHRVLSNPLHRPQNIGAAECLSRENLRPSRHLHSDYKLALQPELVFKKTIKMTWGWWTVELHYMEVTLQTNCQAGEERPCTSPRKPGIQGLLLACLGKGLNSDDSGSPRRTLGRSAGLVSKQVWLVGVDGYRAHYSGHSLEQPWHTPTPWHIAGVHSCPPTFNSQLPALALRGGPQRLAWESTELSTLRWRVT
ncbi:LOW QUALITY PROTEIN: hypothetical protein QTO34_004200 [Cnephaeus nilssonii]|uniref:Uncharacterized protein n=1 Tax=Cnephaeus nilssonii TaxID=3371016 RepID=A0AA40HS97_CNENI|nr:LOW QUALITY PROTEIN: hypothetical protein QTO34_004200 [Eptesicus nilssonii]